jgi:hypothetical protein
VRWPDDGPWWITAHWAQVDGRPAIVGLDIRSYFETSIDDGDVVRTPVGDKLAEVTQRVLRGISISAVRDATRQQLLDSVSFTATLPAEDVAELADRGYWAAERLTALTAKGEPRKRRPAANDELLRHVAALYAYAVGSGDKAPAKYVEDQLRADGEPRLSTAGGRVLVRQWIRRARERGYLDHPAKGGDQ